MSQPVIQFSFPRAPLIAMAGMVLAALVGVTAVRVTGVGAVHVADAAAVATRELRFEDRPDGSIAVLDATGTQLLDTVAPESNGFLRGTMRGLARERKREGIGPELPFKLIGRADGRLTLEDPGTGRRVDLGSFGPTNAAVFAHIMSNAMGNSTTAPTTAPVASGAPSTGGLASFSMTVASLQDKP